MLYMKSVTTDDYELAKKFFPVVEYNQVLSTKATNIKHLIRMIHRKSGKIHTKMQKNTLNWLTMCHP